MSSYHGMSVFCTILLHLLLSWVSLSKPHLFMSCLMLSIHLILGLPITLVPGTFIFVVCFTVFHSSICTMFTYHHNMWLTSVLFSIPKSILCSSLLSLSISVTVTTFSFLLFPKASPPSFLLSVTLLFLFAGQMFSSLQWCQMAAPRTRVWRLLL